MVMAMTAADDCTQKVITPPRNRNISVVRNEFGSNDEKKLSSASLWPRSIWVPVMRSVPSPRIRKARPKRKSPM